MKAKFISRFNGKTTDYYEMVGVFEDVTLEEYAKVINIFEYETDMQTGYKSPYKRFLDDFDVRIFGNIKVDYTSKDSFELTVSMSDDYLTGIETEFQLFFVKQFYNN